jgi:putative peptidoglycan lipid II flippase
VIGAYAWYGRMAPPGAGPADLPSGALDVLAWGTTAGVVAMCVPALVVMARAGWLPTPRLGFPEGVALRVRSLALAGVAGVAAQQVAVLVITLIAGHGTDGTRTVFQWTNQVYLLPYAVLVVPLVTSAFPRLSEQAARGQHDRLARLSAASTRAVVVIAGAGAACLAAAAPAVAMVFAVLDRDQSSLVEESMTPALTLMLPGLVGVALMFHGQRTLYALERGRAALVAGAVGWGAVSVATLVGFAVIGPGGSVLHTLAVAVTVGMTIGGVVTVVTVARIAGRAAVAGVARTAAVLVVGGAFGALIGRWVADSVILLLGNGIWPALGAGAGAGLVALVAAGLVLYLGDRTAVREMARRVRPRRA